ncbi:non-hydrolyzing UDP-N-acetylglucosamine 2-epimerase [Nitrospira moscoviensis]|uniref:UDP-N-acetylglucosamine 2-epimerase-like protein n=1 Tax=Nitrospira moscoviensis TaxID=42253 RepID=A0A0K2GFR0_NITMO|nr:UDP-N-acetylglucosamine 2-epimerase (non-hydrolyzing) [Nitrospira moscoviensis]ALA59791.1 UDP-N-acetylglucosamine 2-epimerase-like protein [Nitrospira moscoviensis]
MKIMNIVGARPNFIKIAPLIREMRARQGVEPLLVHTGQHYDVKMAGRFFEDLGIPSPDVSLDVGSGSHAFQTAEVMKRIEPVMEQQRPDLVLVVGDVNSTLAAAVTAAKLQIPVAHVEAGLRSFDRSMPEEINRLVTDAVSTYLFVSEESGMKNLAAEGADMARVFFVGNVMIDSLEASRRMWERSSIQEQLGVTKGQYGVLTLHRPSNVDQPAVLRGLLEAIAEIGREQPIVFPVHPRTRKRLEDTQELNALLRFTGSGTVQGPGIWCLDPLGYLDFMALVAGARLILTDSGGIQEETTALGIPCLTLRENTERPVTISHGTNRLVGTSPEKIVEEAMRVLKGPRVAPSPPPLWDGHAAKRIVSIILERCR